MYKKIYLIIVLFLQTILLNAQVKTDFNNTEKINENGKFNLPYQVKNEEILAPDLTSAYAKEKEELSKVSKIFFFAKAVSVKIDIPSKINWIEKGEYSYGRYTLKSMGAKTLSINFNNFFLPKGTEMYIYSSNGEMITGIITDNENNKNKVWGSSIYKGDEVNIGRIQVINATFPLLLKVVKYT